MGALTRYNPEILSSYSKDGFISSENLEFISELINFEKNTIPLD